MLITRTSALTGRVHSIDLPITQKMIDAYNSGALLQQAFPHLSPSDREFWKTGATSEEWKKVFGSAQGEINAWNQVSKGEDGRESWRCDKTGKTIVIE